MGWGAGRGPFCTGRTEGAARGPAVNLMVHMLSGNLTAWGPNPGCATWALWPIDVIWTF